MKEHAHIIYFEMIEFLYLGLVLGRTLKNSSCEAHVHSPFMFQRTGPRQSKQDEVQHAPQTMKYHARSTHSNHKHQHLIYPTQDKENIPTKQARKARPTKQLQGLLVKQEEKNGLQNNQNMSWMQLKEALHHSKGLAIPST